MEGVIVQINEVGLKWLGRPREEVVGKLRLADLMTPASAKALLESREQIEEGGWVRDLKIEIVRSDGSSLALLFNAGATRDADGRLVAIHSVVFEPERKRLKLPL
jgi:PAS domain-containing protein